MVERSEPPMWRQRLLSVVGASRGAENLRLLTAWHRAEGKAAQWNPLNTTYKLNNSSSFNKVGVQNYSRPTEGVCATALTLVNGFYNGILGDLQGGKLTAEQIVRQNWSEFQKWGTNPTVILAVLKEV